MKKISAILVTVVACSDPNDALLGARHPEDVAASRDGTVAPDPSASGGSDDDRNPPGADPTDAGSDAGSNVKPRAGFFVVVGYGGLRARSNDGLTWTDGTFDTERGGDDANLLRDVAAAPGRIVTAGWKVKHSTDAKTWTNDQNLEQWFGGIAYGKGTWVAAGGIGRRAWSADGLAWTKVDDRRPTSYRMIAYGDVLGGRWTAVGDQGIRAWTGDGKTWTASTGDVTFGLSDVAFGNGVFVAVGSGGAIATSRDGGASWSRESQTLNGAQGIVHSPIGFVIVGGGKHWTSETGSSWTEGNGPAGAGPLAYGNGAFVTMGFYGDVFRSTNGNDWSRAGKVSLGSNGIQRVRFVTP